MSTFQNNLSLKQRRLLAKEIATEYGSWKRKLHREPTEDERRQIVAIGFSKARHRRPGFPEANPSLIDVIAGLGYLVTKPEGSVILGPAEAVPMVNPMPDNEGDIRCECGKYIYVKAGDTECECGRCYNAFGNRIKSSEQMFRERRDAQMYGPNPSLPAMVAGAVVGNVVANALSNPGKIACPVCYEKISIKVLASHLRKTHTNPGDPSRIQFKQHPTQHDTPHNSEFCSRCFHENYCEPCRAKIAAFEARRKEYYDRPRIRPNGERDPEFGLEGRPCSACSGPLMFLGTLGMMDHYQCRNCGMTASANRASEVKDRYLRREFGYGENPLTVAEARHVSDQAVRDVDRTRRTASGSQAQGFYAGRADAATDIIRQYGPPFMRENPLLMTVMGANPGAPYRHRQENPRRRGRKVTVSLQEFAKRVKAANDPALWNNFIAKIKGYQKWSHGTLPSKVTVEQVDVPGVKGMMIMFDMGKQPESTYIMPDGTKRKGAWKHPWDSMPDMKGDGQAGIIITKLKGKNKLTDFLHG